VRTKTRERREKQQMCVNKGIGIMTYQVLIHK
jgi:hypothetical protein